jgi:hypothetical protein
MSMSKSILANELATLIPVNTEGEAITNLADAYSVYVSDAQALTPILFGGIELGRAAMVPALSGLSLDWENSIQSGVIAFWSAVAGGLATSFASAIAITPPTGNSSLAAALGPVFTSNKEQNKSLIDAAAAVADVMHAAAIAGGTVTTPGAPVVVTPIT